MSETAWVRATPEQLARSNELGAKWREEAADPIVAVGAATGVLLNVINQDVPTEHQVGCVEAVYASLRQLIYDIDAGEDRDDGDDEEEGEEEPEYVTITLSNRGPVRIKGDDWSVVAVGGASEWRGQRDDPTSMWSAGIVVRQHSRWALHRLRARGLRHPIRQRAGRHHQGGRTTRRRV